MKTSQGSHLLRPERSRIFLVISVEVWLHLPPLALQAVSNRLAHRGATKLRWDSTNYHAKRHCMTKTLSRRWLRNRSQCRILHSRTPSGLQKRQIPLWIVLENTTGSEMHVGGIRGMTSVRIQSLWWEVLCTASDERVSFEILGCKWFPPVRLYLQSQTGHIPALGNCLILHMYLTCWLPLTNE